MFLLHWKPKILKTFWKSFLNFVCLFKRIVDGVQVTITFTAKPAELPPSDENEEDEEE